MKRPMAAFNRVAKATESARCSLSEYSEIDEVPVRPIPNIAEAKIDARVQEDAAPKIRVGKLTAVASYVRRCCRYGQMNESISPSSTASVLPVSTFVR